MKKQKSGYVKREGLSFLPKGEPVVFIDTECKLYSINVKLSKKSLERIRKAIKNAIYGHFPTKKKPEKVWSVS